MRPSEPMFFWGFYGQWQAVLEKWWASIFPALFSTLKSHERHKNNLWNSEAEGIGVSV